MNAFVFYTLNFLGAAFLLFQLILFIFSFITNMCIIISGDPEPINYFMLLFGSVIIGLVVYACTIKDEE